MSKSKIEEHYRLHTEMLGAPIHEERTCSDGVGRFRTYERGSIHFHPETGAWETHGGIRDFWARLGWENSFLGYPTSDEGEHREFDLLIVKRVFPVMGELPTNKTVGRCSFFQGGCIVWCSDPDSRNRYGEYMLLLRPNRNDNWRLISRKTNKCLMERIMGIEQVRLQDIPSDYGRSIWVRG